MAPTTRLRRIPRLDRARGAELSGSPAELGARLSPLRLISAKKTVENGRPARRRPFAEGVSTRLCSRPLAAGAVEVGDNVSGPDLSVRRVPPRRAEKCGRGTVLATAALLAARSTPSTYRPGLWPQDIAAPRSALRNSLAGMIELHPYRRRLCGLPHRGRPASLPVRLSRPAEEAAGSSRGGALAASFPLRVALGRAAWLVERVACRSLRLRASETA